MAQFITLLNSVFHLPLNFNYFDVFASFYVNKEQIIACREDVKAQQTVELCCINKPELLTLNIIQYVPVQYQSRCKEMHLQICGYLSTSAKDCGFNYASQRFRDCSATG